jgi:hypothetical protein
MSDALIPITRRHYANQTLLEAGILTNQEWAYDEGAERFGVLLSDGTFRYHGRSELFAPGAGVTAIVAALAGGVGIKTTLSRGMLSLGTPSEELHVIDVVNGSASGSVVKSLKLGYNTSGIAYADLKAWT